MNYYKVESESRGTLIYQKRLQSMDNNYEKTIDRHN